MQAVFGLALLALGLAMLIAAEGPDPWGVFLLGLQRFLPLTLGVVAQIGGLGLIILNVVWGRRMPGLATVMSMLLVGWFLDLFLARGIAPEPASLPVQILVLASGILIFSTGIVTYVRAGLGEGPVEAMMFVLSKRLKLPVGRAKVLQDCMFVVGGLFLGTPLRLGTLITAFSVGPVTGWLLDVFERRSNVKSG